MISDNYALLWEPFKNHLSKGFSKLQQMQEFIDVTLAAEDHFVGAHQNILALASPYFKELLKSAPCPHPVIFLGPINHTVLAFILEYIYTGEVKIPSHVLPSFVQASKMLHIIGIKDMELPEKVITMNTSITGAKADDTKRPVNIPEQVMGGQLNEYFSTIKDLNPPQTLIGFESSLPIQSSAENIDNYGLMNSIAHVTIDEENQVTVEPLDEMSTSQYTINNQAANMSSDTHFDDRSPNFTACIQIDDESCKVSVQPLMNYNTENHVHTTITHDSQKEVIQDQSTTTNKADYEMETDFENLIESKVLKIGPEINIENVQSESEFERNTHEENVPTDFGLVTITHLTNKTNQIDENGECSDYNKILANITTALYAISSRGSIEMILNRYIYNLHFTSQKGCKCRWRCIDYRKNQCPAYIDTLNEDIDSRKHTHNHSVHDTKIIKLGQRKQLYTSLIEAKKFKKKVKKQD